MGAHRRHTRTTTDEHHFGVGVLGKELAERTGDGHLVTSLQAEDVGRHLAGRGSPVAGRRGCDPHVQHDDAELFRIVRHGVGTDDRLVDLGLQLEDLEAIPVPAILLGNIEVLVLHVVGRGFDLDITTGAERHALPIGDLQLELLDEGGLVVIGDDGTVPLLHAEDLFRQLDVHVGTDGDLTGQTLAMTGFALADVIQLGRQDVAAAGFHTHLALTTRAAAATGGGDEDTTAGEHAKQLATRRAGHSLGRVAVDADCHVTGGHQLGLGEQNDCHQGQQDHGEHDHTQNNFHLYFLSDYREIPEKDMKPSAIRPAVMKVMPRPRRPSGTSEYFIFSRIPAIATIASIQPAPEPTP